MNHTPTILKLAVSLAFALLVQVACAQSEYSFEQRRVPAETESAEPELASPNLHPLQFSQLPKFTAPQEGADELIGPPPERPGPAVATAANPVRASRARTKITIAPPATSKRPLIVPRVPTDLLNERPAEKVAAQATAVIDEKKSLLGVASLPPVSQVAAEPIQFARNAEPIDEGTWQANSYANSSVVIAGGDFFSDHSTARFAQSELSQPVPPLVKASAVELTDPVNDPGTLGLTLNQPKTLGLAQPKAVVAKLIEPPDPTAIKPRTNTLKEPAAKLGKAPAKKTPAKKAPAKKAAKTPAKKPAKKDGSDLPHVLHGAKNFKLAAQPEQGAHFRDDSPLTDPRAHKIESIADDFSPGPAYDSLPYVPFEQQNVYSGKKLYANQRPLVELGRPWYQLGQLSEGYNWFGNHNRITPQFLIYGDFRTAIASYDVGGDSSTRTASELNLDIDLKLTGTERFHAFVSPLDNGVENTGYSFDDDEFVSQLDANFDFGYFEGDLGAIVGGFTGETLPFDLPFAVGVFPLLIQNGVWFDDAFLGIAATLPARNSARLNISNMDITFFAGYDKISSDAFPGDDGAARLYGVASFIEAANGYFEIDYAFLDDRSFDNRSYHNFAFAFTRRYGRLVSNSTRVIVNAGQASNVVENTADGVLLLSENSLITGAPSTVVPYFNFFAGFDRPQSAARAVQAGGVLRNTGILFESDGLTGFPTLDPTANDTYGAALGLNLLADDFSQQLLVEVAALGVIGDDSQRNAAGEQFGVGFRYQLPLSNSMILRADGMYGFLNNADDIHGVRMELRRKW